MLPSGPVVYLMSRDQRAADNWALLHAAQRAAGAGRQLAVAFTLFPSFAGTSAARHFGFMLRGLAETAAALEARGIPFLLLRGQAAEAVPPLLARLGCSLLVTDFSPLREGRAWRAALAAAAACPVEEVDAHNVVPVWRASPKLEYAARTIRPKITAALPEFLTDFPPLPTLPGWDAAAAAGIAPPDWPTLISEATRANSAAEAVPEVDWLRPGEAAAAAALSAFLQPSRLRLYEKRNDPNCPQALSGLSPYLHYGQVSAQRCALAARAAGGGAACDSFLEELVVRKELSDNFCLHNPHYDSLAGASEWARASLAAHAGDKREHLYGRRELEEAKTADRLWNAAQLEMVHTGKMHGWCRMYWAKKILEWTESPEVALREAIYLNDSAHVGGGRARVRVGAHATRSRRVQLGRARPKRLRGVHVEHRRHPRHGLGGAACVWQDPLYELCVRALCVSPPLHASLTRARTQRRQTQV